VEATAETSPMETSASESTTVETSCSKSSTSATARRDGLSHDGK
jgi:hypothetical protein